MAKTKPKPEKDYWFEMCMNNTVRYHDEVTDERGWYEEYVTLYSTKKGELNKWIAIREYTLEDLKELKKRFDNHVKAMKNALDVRIKEMELLDEGKEK